MFRDAGAWRRLQATGMRQDFSWGRSAAKYVAAYQRVIAAAGAAGHKTISDEPST